MAATYSRLRSEIAIERMTFNRLRDPNAKIKVTCVLATREQRAAWNKRAH